MSQKSRFLAVLTATLAVACGIPAFAAKPPKLSYQILQLDLVEPNGVVYTRSFAYGISSQGQVVGGVSNSVDQFSPAYWTTSVVDGKVQSTLNLLVPYAGNAGASGINENGEIVGEGKTDDGHNVGLYWADAASAPQDLPPLDGDDGSRAFAINKNGVICGCSTHSFVRDDGQVIDEPRAVVWRVNGGILVCGPVELPTAQFSSAEAISDNDITNCARVVGSSYPDTSASDSAVEWTVLDNAGTLTVVDSEVLNDVGVADALGVNNGGKVCGRALTQTTTGWNAVVWTGDSTQTLNGARFFYSPAARDINNKGVIVGTAQHKVSLLRAVMWPSATGSMVVLDQFLDDSSPFGILCAADAVNDSGAIVGFGWDGTEWSAFLAVPQ